MPQGDELPPGWMQMVTDVAKATAGIEYIRGTVDALKSDVAKIEANQVPLSEHSQMMSDVRQLRDQYVVIRAVSWFGTAVAVAALGGWVAKILGYPI